MEDERLGLRAAETAVRADQLLERGDLAELGVVLAEQQQVGRMDHRVLALEAHDRVRPEQLGRVLALDLVLVEEARALRAEDDRAELLRADQQQPDARVCRDRGDEPGWSSSSSSTVSRWSCPVNQTRPRLPEPTTAMVVGSAIGGSSSTSSRLTVPSASVLLAQGGRATLGPTPLLAVISDSSALTKVDPSALVLDWMIVARPPISSRMYSPRLTP